MDQLSYKSAFINNVHFVRWSSPPTQNDLKALPLEWSRFSRESRKPFVLVSTVGPKTRVPQPEERKNLNALLDESRKYCSSVHMVAEGNELQHNLQRVIISGMLILTRIFANDDFVHIHKNADQIVPFLKKLGVDGQKIIDEARARGLVL